MTDDGLAVGTKTFTCGESMTFTFAPVAPVPSQPTFTLHYLQHFREREASPEALKPM